VSVDHNLQIVINDGWVASFIGDGSHFVSESAFWQNTFIENLVMNTLN
jgi:hypothetical protein